jgi:hypothetical protein
MILSDHLMASVVFLSFHTKYRKSKTDEKEKTRNPSDETVVSNNDLQSDEVSSTSQPIPSTSLLELD